MKNRHYIDKYDREVWVKWWVYHREDGPAVIWKDGSQFWYLNGDYHRKNGPAIIWKDGSKHWYKNGVPHRENGPAVIRSNGVVEYWLEGIPYKNEVLLKMEVQKLKRSRKGANDRWEKIPIPLKIMIDIFLDTRRLFIKLLMMTKIGKRNI